jgi:hypothetical protein
MEDNTRHERGIQERYRKPEKIQSLEVKSSINQN